MSPPTAVYGGYFGAAQGVILVSLLAMMLSDPLQYLNALKNAIVMQVNGLATVIFLFSGHVALEPPARRWGAAPRRLCCAR